MKSKNGYRSGCMEVTADDPYENCLGAVREKSPGNMGCRSHGNKEVEKGGIANCF